MAAALLKPHCAALAHVLADEKAVPKDTGDQRLLRSAKVLERMIIQDANIDIAFGEF